MGGLAAREMVMAVRVGAAVEVMNDEEEQVEREWREEMSVMRRDGREVERWLGV